MNINMDMDMDIEIDQESESSVATVDLKEQYNNILSSTEHQRKTILSQESDQILNTVTAANKLFNHISFIKSSHVAALDAKLLTNAASLASERVHNLKVESGSFDIHTFVDLCRLKLSSTNVQNTRNWDAFAPMVATALLKIPALDFMLGPLAIEPKIRKESKRGPKLTKDLKDLTKPTELTRDELSSNENETTANVKRIGDRLQQIGSINVFKFFINPNSFSETVENLFYLSFLIRDGKAVIEDDEEGVPMIEACDPPSEEDYMEGAQKHQSIFHLDMKTFHLLIEKEMTSLIKFTPLSGAKNLDYLCYLLELDDCKILLDCGWHLDCLSETLEKLLKITKTIDAVLISHGNIQHLGALPYLYAKAGLSCTTYSTIPVHSMGQMALYDLYKSKKNEEDFNTFSLKDVDAAFDKMVTLRYSQPYSLLGNGVGISITAYPAGHTIGGTIWKIKKGGDTIVYAVDYNHKKERHLNGTILHVSGDLLSRPTLLITDAYNATTLQPTRKLRDLFLFETILTTLNSDGNVLIPMDSSCRVLELVYLLEQQWDFHKPPFHFILFSHQASKTLNMAKNMLEWMGDAASQAFAQRDNPFDFKCLKVIHSMQDLKALNGPKLVIASLESLDVGFSFKLFREWAKDPSNTVILPDRGPSKSITRTLYDLWFEKTSKEFENENIKPAVTLDLEMTLNIKEKVPLEGDELQAFLDLEAEKAAIEEQEKINRAQAEADEDDDDMSESEEIVLSKLDGTEKTIHVHSYDIYVKDMPRTSGFFKHSQTFRMFPIHQSHCRVDDFGEIIDPSQYMREEEQTAIEAAAIGEPTKSEAKKVVFEEEVIDTVPSKYVESEEIFTIACKVVYIDFEGRSDGKSIKNILSQVAPRKMIFIHGSEQDTDHLTQYCKDNPTITDEVYSPSVGECLDVSSATNLFKVTLTDSLVSSINISQYGDYQLSFISGIIKKDDQKAPNIEDEIEAEAEAEAEANHNLMETDEKKDTSDIIMEDAEETETKLILDVAPSDTIKFHRPVMIGDIKLSEFRQLLISRGFQSDFVSGALIVNGSVLVKKEGTNLALEGSINADYFSVRRLLYDLHAIV